MGVHNSTVLVRAQYSHPRLWGFGGVSAALGTHRKADRQAQEISVIVPVPQSPSPSSLGSCHRDSGLALTSLSRPCHIWLPGSPHGNWQD